MTASGPVRIEDDKLLRGRGIYVADLPRPDALALVFVRSPVGHGRIRSIDTTRAEAAPGVVAVFTGATCGLPPFLEFPMVNGEMLRPYLAHDVVRFAGEAVAAVVADREDLAFDAATLVDVEYDLLPAVVDPEAALEGETLLFPAAGTNVAFALPPSGDADFAGCFAECEVVVRQRMVNNRVAIAPMEGRSVLAEWDGTRLTAWISGQGPHPFRDKLAGALGLELDSVRVIHPEVGGGFGAKALPHPEEIVVPWIAMQLGRPVRWTETRTEALLSQGHGRGQVQHVELGGTRDGQLLAYKLRVLQDCGGYPRLGALLPNMTRTVMTGQYAIPHISFEAESVVTNTNPVVAYRGAGAPESAAALERAVDLFATEIGMDPVEVRRRNLIPADAFPYSAPSGAVYDSGDYEKGLDAALSMLGYDDVRAEQARRRAAGNPVQLGVGASLFVDSTSSSNGSEWARVEVLADGGVRAWTGTSPHGQGHATTWAMLIERELGVPVDRVEVLHGDSEHFPTGTITGGSRSVQVGGEAIRRAAIEVREAAAAVAAAMLEADPADMVFDRAGGRFHVAGSPSVAVSLAEAAVTRASEGGCLDAVLRFDPAGGTFSSGAYFAVAEVDVDTGKVTLRRLVTIDDAGTIVNHMAFEGQVHGGAAQGLSQALYEEVVYDPDGNPLTSTLAEYAMPSAAEMPSFEAGWVETPTPKNALGAKGVGESGPLGAMPAVQNAVVDAVSYLGVRHIDLPLTPERVWTAIQEAR